MKAGKTCQRSIYQFWYVKGLIILGTEATCHKKSVDVKMHEASVSD